MYPMNPHRMAWRTLPLVLAATAACTDGKDPVDDTDPPIVIPDTVDSAAGPDGNDDVATADALDISGIEMNSINGVAQGVISPAGDRDFYSVELTGGQPYFIMTNAYDPQRDLVVLDTVLRIYDDTGTFLTENDDMMFRFRETDSGIWITPETTSTYYIEVMDFGDWSPDYDAEGSSRHEYLLVIAMLEPSEHEDDNDTIAAVQADPLLADPDDDAYDPVYWSSFFDSYETEWIGRINSPGDVDVWPVEIRVEDPEDDGYTPEPYFFLSTSLWPGAPGDLRISVLNEAGEVMAATDNVEPGAETAIVWATDPAILLKVDEGSNYYIQVEDSMGNAYPASSYSGVYFNYLPSLASVEDADDDNDDQATADFTATERSSTTDDLFFIGVWGSLPTGDDADWFKLDKSDVDGFDGKFVSIVVQAMTIGSALDAKVKLVQPDGTVVAEATVDADDANVDDPTILDVEISGDTNLFVVVEPEARLGPDTQCNYLVGAYVSAEELFQD